MVNAIKTLSAANWFSNWQLNTMAKPLTARVNVLYNKTLEELHKAIHTIQLYNAAKVHPVQGYFQWSLDILSSICYCLPWLKVEKYTHTQLALTCRWSTPQPPLILFLSCSESKLQNYHEHKIRLKLAKSNWILFCLFKKLKGNLKLDVTFTNILQHPLVQSKDNPNQLKTPLRGWGLNPQKRNMSHS